MNVDQIKVGKTYVGKKGKTRTVVSIARNGDVAYHNGNPELTKTCWKWTFGGWAKGEQTLTEQEERDKRIREAATCLYQALKPFAKMAETGFVGSVFEGVTKDDDTVVLVHHATATKVTLGDFNRALIAYNSV